MALRGNNQMKQLVERRNSAEQSIADPNWLKKRIWKILRLFLI